MANPLRGPWEEAQGLRVPLAACAQFLIPKAVVATAETHFVPLAEQTPKASAGVTLLPATTHRRQVSSVTSPSQLHVLMHTVAWVSLVTSMMVLLVSLVDLCVPIPAPRLPAASRPQDRPGTGKSLRKSLVTSEWICGF